MGETISTVYLPHFLHQVILLLFTKACTADFLTMDSLVSICLAWKNRLTFPHQQCEKKMVYVFYSMCLNIYVF